jgi:hypothetical protein
MLNPKAKDRISPPKLVFCAHVSPETAAVSVTGLPAHTVVVEAVITGAVGNAFIEMLDGLLVPVIAGVLLTTLMRYNVPATVDEGIVAVMVPAAVLVRVPIATGLVNEPVLLLSCAVNTLPAVKVPVIV